MSKATRDVMTLSTMLIPQPVAMYCTSVELQFFNCQKNCTQLPWQKHLAIHRITNLKATWSRFTQNFSMHLMCCLKIHSYLNMLFFVVQSLSHIGLFCDPMNCNPLDFSVHGIFQARILEWVVISFSKGSSQPRDWTSVTCISCIAGIFFTNELPGKPKYVKTMY